MRPGDEGRSNRKGSMKDEDKAKVTRAQLMRGVMENWAAELEWFALSARINRAKYLALIKEGFTEAQALELCK